jgi:deltex-like protein
VVFYLGPDFTTYEVNLATKLQTNKLTGTQRYIREAPHAALSAIGGGGAQTAQEAAQLVVSSARRVVVFDADDSCAICLEAFDAHGAQDQRGYQLSECGPHYFHAECIQKQLIRNGKCAVCSKHYIVNTGNQPVGSTMSVQHYPPGSGYSLAGFPADVGVIVIMYSIPSGIQGPEHPNPGVHFSGTYRHAFLPDNREGQEVLRLLRICFDRRLTFTVGRSLTTGCDNVVTWNGVHHKTSTHGGPAYFGFPDDSYFFRVKLELAAKGIGMDLL